MDTKDAVMVRMTKTHQAQLLPSLPSSFLRQKITGDSQPWQRTV